MAFPTGAGRANTSRCWGGKGIRPRWVSKRVHGGADRDQRRLWNFEHTDLIGAVYAQHVYQPIRRFSINGGARWDVDSQFGHRLVPRAAAIWRAVVGGIFKLIFSEAFRAPTLDEAQLSKSLVHNSGAESPAGISPVGRSGPAAAVRHAKLRLRHLSITLE